MDDFSFFGESGFGGGLLADIPAAGMDNATSMIGLDQLYQNWLSEGNEGTFADFTAQMDAGMSENNAATFGADDASDGKAGREDNSLTEGIKDAASAGLLSPTPMIGLSQPSQSQASPIASVPQPEPPSAPVLPARASAFAPMFEQKEERFNLPSGFLARTAQIESNFNPNAQNPRSSAGGLFQFINSTARQYGLQDRFDPVQATEAAARLASDNADILRRGLGREPTAGELYLAHQQGAGGALNLLRNPSAMAEDVVGRAAARLNAGTGLTAGQFASRWTSKFDDLGGSPLTQASAFAPDPPPRPGNLPTSYEARMAGMGAFPAQSGGFTQSSFPRVENVTTSEAELLRETPGLLSPDRAIPGDVPLANMPTMRGGIDPGFLYQETPRPLPPESPFRMAPAANVPLANVPSPPRRPADLPAEGASIAKGRSAMPQQDIPPDYSTWNDAGIQDFLRRDAEQRGAVLPNPFGGLGSIISDGVTGVGNAISRAVGGGALPAPPQGQEPVTRATPEAAPVSRGAGQATAASSGSSWYTPQMDAFLGAASAALMSGNGAAFAPTYQAILASAQDRANTAGQQAAIASVLTKQGLPAEEAALVARSPQAAQMMLGVIQQQQERARIQGFQSDQFGGGSASAAPASASAPATNTPAAPAPASSAPTSQTTPASPQDQRQTAENQQMARDEAAIRALMQRYQNTLRSAAARGLDANNPNVKATIDQIKEEMKPINARLSRPQVNVDNRQERAFDSTTGKAIAERMQKFVEEGDQAVVDLNVITDLRALGERFTTGGPAALQAWLAERGIKVGDNVGVIEAYDALINRLTPQQRVPGSGATSDFDARMFRASLPRIINTPEGNEFVVSSMERLADNRIKRADIAQRVQIGEMSSADGIRALRALQEEARQISVAAREKAFGKGTPDQQGGQQSAAAAGQQPSTRPAVPRAGSVMDGWRFKGGDPSNRNNWERVQ